MRNNIERYTLRKRDLSNHQKKNNHFTTQKLKEYSEVSQAIKQLYEINWEEKSFEKYIETLGKNLFYI